MYHRDFTDRFIRHRNFQRELTQRGIGPSDDFNFTLVQRSGGSERHLAAFPDRYLRRDFKLFLEPRDSPNLAPDATFFRSVPLAEPDLNPVDD